ncbi:MAG: fibronectin type III domain-containing protein [Planctomycetota bacterium]|jgi:hypothetical protein
MLTNTKTNRNLYVLLTALTLVAVFAVDANATAPLLWVLHNEDWDYTNPPFDDSLTGVDGLGEAVLRRTGFNICQTVGGHRAIAVSDIDQTVLVCENVSWQYSGIVPRLSKWDYQGNKIFAITRHNTYSAVDIADDGTIYALTSKGTIYGYSMLKILLDGNIVAEELISGFDLAVDEVLGGIYVVGADIKYCTPDLGLEWTIDPVGWCAVSVDTCSDGTAWVAERRHSQIPSSADRLHHVSRSGTILQTVDVDYPPFCVRVDKWDNSIYVASADLYKYNSAGILQWSVPLPPGPWNLAGWSLAIDAYRRGIWVGTMDDVRLISFDGTTVLTVDEFPRADQKYVACPETRAPHAPSWPDGSTLTAPDVGLTSVMLSWTPAEHGLGVAEYLLYQNGTLIDTVAGMDTGREVTGLDPNTEYTFKVEACDGEGNCTTDGPSATVQTLTAVGAIQRLIIQVIGLNLQQGIENGLDGKLTAALGALDDINKNNDVGAINTLEAFINAVQAQSGSKISTEDANALIAAAEEIIAILSGG